ncbi:MAG: GNAT family N-acetyltransferase [Hyphomicrobiales bacterium]
MQSAWQGKLVRLRAIEPGDWEVFQAWDADTDANRHGWRVHFPRSAGATRAWAEQESRKERSDADDTFRFVVETLDGVPVGSLNVHDADRLNGTFEYGINIAREHWAHGYAADAIIVVLRYFFRERRYQKANATVYAFNERSLALHRKLGFVEEGRLRRMHYTGGEYHDEYWFGMTAEEFEARYG